MSYIEKTRAELTAFIEQFSASQKQIADECGLSATVISVPKRDLHRKQ